MALWRAIQRGLRVHASHLVEGHDAFSDFPMPQEWPAYPSRIQIEEYFKNYAKHFGLYPLIRFNDGVAKLERSGSGWRATFDKAKRATMKPS
jgi:cation diffusion facilitator CzcD-associated flavoprotein CzcO